MPGRPHLEPDRPVKAGATRSPACQRKHSTRHAVASPRSPMTISIRSGSNGCWWPDPVPTPTIGDLARPYFESKARASRWTTASPPDQPAGHRSGRLHRRHAGAAGDPSTTTPSRFVDHYSDLMYSGPPLSASSVRSAPRSTRGRHSARRRPAARHRRLVIGEIDAHSLDALKPPGATHEAILSAVIGLATAPSRLIQLIPSELAIDSCATRIRACARS